MTVTVVVCTWNRAAELRETLRRLGSAHVPWGVECRTLVVDNGSQDETSTVAGQVPAFGATRVVTEPRPGLSNARNRALAECEGADVGAPHYLIWIDDDVSVPREWVQHYVDAFRSHPDAAIFGGPVVPELTPPPPRWLLGIADDVEAAWSAIDLGPEGPLGPGIDRLPYGANFAVRQDAVGSLTFDEELGRKQAGLGRGGEEIRFLHGVLEAGFTGWWVPEAGVAHRIGPDRQTLSYLLRYFEADGFDAEIRERHPASLWRRMRLFAGWVRASGAALGTRVAEGPGPAALRRIEAASLRGRLAAARRPGAPS